MTRKEVRMTSLLLTERQYRIRMTRKREVTLLMARPKKKPGYDREAEIADLIATAAALFDEAYDDRVGRSEDAPTIKSVAEEMETTPLRIRKFLISCNMYSTENSRQIQAMDKRGMSIKSKVLPHKFTNKVNI